jgi:hypothetical protein
MLTAFLLSTALSPAHAAGGDGVVRKADLEGLAEWVEKDRSFTDAKREEARRAIARHQEESTPFTEAAFYMEVRRIVALADNGHSNVDDDPIYARFGLLPLRAYWFSDGLYVVRARAPHAALVGARLQAVEGRPIAELEQRLMDYHGGSVEHFRHGAAASLMLSPALLHAVGLSASPERLRLGVVDRAGKAVETTVPVDPIPIRAPSARSPGATSTPRRSATVPSGPPFSIRRGSSRCTCRTRASCSATSGSRT